MKKINKNKFILPSITIVILEEKDIVITRSDMYPSEFYDNPANLDIFND